MTYIEKFWAKKEFHKFDSRSQMDEQVSTEISWNNMCHRNKYKCIKFAFHGF
jgi:hypothetical protein